MTDNPFSQPPAPGDGIKWGEHLNALVLIVPKSLEEGIKTDYGVSDAIVADVTILDGENAGDEYPDCFVWPKVLQSQLKRSFGQKVLGRVTQGQGKPGQSPPWMLAEATPADQQVGIAYLTAQNTPTSPAPAQQAAPATQGSPVPF